MMTHVQKWEDHKTLSFLMNESDSSNGMTKQEALNKIKGLKAVLPAASNEIDRMFNVLSK